MDRRGFLWMVLAALGLRVAKPEPSGLVFQMDYLDGGTQLYSSGALETFADRVFDKVWEEYNAIRP